MEIDETYLPVSDGGNGACELRGLEPLYVADEEILLVVVTEQDAEKALDIIRKSEYGSNAQIIGKVINHEDDTVYMKGIFGNKRIIEMISGEQLPRIC